MEAHINFLALLFLCFVYIKKNLYQVIESKNTLNNSMLYLFLRNSPKHTSFPDFYRMIQLRITIFINSLFSYGLIEKKRKSWACLVLGTHIYNSQNFLSELASSMHWSVAHSYKIRLVIDREKTFKRISVKKFICDYFYFYFSR